MWIYLPENYESCRFSPGTGGTASDSSLPVSIPGQSAMSRKTPTPSRSCNSDSETSHPPSIPLLYGTTSRLSIPDRGEDTLTSLQPVFPANHIQSPGNETSTTTGISGPKHSNAFGWWDASTSLLRTYQASLWQMVNGNPMASRFWGNLPHWGSVTSDGEFIRHTRQVPPISENGGLFWPTPSASPSGFYAESEETGGKRPDRFITLPRAVVQWATPTSRDYKDSGPDTNYQHAAEKVRLAGQVVVRSQDEVGSLNPDWVEAHLMSLPEGWTRLEPLPEGAYEEWWDGMKDGTWWDTERDLPRLTMTRTARTKRLKMLGNGIVPASARLAITTLEGEA